MKWTKLGIAIAFIGLWVTSGCGKGSSKSSPEASSQQIEKDSHKEHQHGEKVKDIVCGMELAKDKAKIFEYKGKTFYFDSDKCLVKFKGRPSSYPTGLPGESCICKTEMPRCGCGHCKGKDEPCLCGEEKEEHEHNHEH